MDVYTKIPNMYIKGCKRWEQAFAPEYPNIRIGFVHIDDVVKAQVLAMEVPTAHGQYICSSDVAHFGDIMSMLQTKYPKLQIQASR